MLADGVSKEVDRAQIMGERIRTETKEPDGEKSTSAINRQKINFSQAKNSPFDYIMSLQRSIGNQSVQRLLESGVIQAKLRIGSPNDIYEQEADRVADQVLRMPGISCPECEEEREGIIQTKPLAEQITPLIQRQTEEEEEEKIQTRPIDGRVNQVVQRQKKEEEELLRPYPFSELMTPLVQRQIEEEEEKKKEEEEILRKERYPSQSAEITSDLETYIHSLKGGGQPLPESERVFFEPRFGYDFSQLRIHTDPQASRLTKAVNARAFTLGPNIIFGAGQYRPGSVDGQRLLAHELTHVVQQNWSHPSDSTQTLQRQGEREGESIESPPILPESAGLAKPDYGINIDILDPKNSSLIIGGFSLPSPRTMIEILGKIKGLGRKDLPPPILGFPELKLSDEELQAVACKVLPKLCPPKISVLPPTIPPLKIPELKLSLPKFRRPRLFYVSRAIIDHFIYNKASIPDRHRLKLDEITTRTIEQASHVLDIEGHTDTHGSASDNKKLSEKRAENTEAYLIKCGVPDYSIWRVIGLGESRSLYADDKYNWLSAARNRRVEIITNKLSWSMFVPLDLVLRPPGTQPLIKAVYTPGMVKVAEFIEKACNQILASITKSPSGTGLLTSDNENILALLSLLKKLVNDLKGRRIKVLHDPKLLGGKTRAYYSATENVLKVRPLPNRPDLPTLNLVATDIVHEYTHYFQDRIRERLLLAKRAPVETTRDWELYKEIEARRNEVYFLELLQKFGIGKGAVTTELFNALVSAGLLVKEFEKERTGSPKEQIEARREIYTKIRTYYKKQIKTHAPSLEYLIEINDYDEAELITDKDNLGIEKSVKLGKVSAASLFSPSSLRIALENLIKKHNIFKNKTIFKKSGKVFCDYITFIAFRNGVNVAEGVICQTKEICERFRK